MSFLVCLLLAQIPGEMPGLHNLHEARPGLISGSGPEGDEGFASLKKLGIKTIITVDGARPDLKRAKNQGMRYVHIPIGYNGITQEQGWRIAQAVRDLPGPIYLHCHHGKHRGPTAAAVVKRCLDRECTVDQALAFMKKAGTSPSYLGLYAAPEKLPIPTKDDLDKLPRDFPEAAKVSKLAQAMVEIDEHFELLKHIQKAGWKTPSNHPDLVPLQEVHFLAEHYENSAKAQKGDLAAALRDAGAQTRMLEPLLSANPIVIRDADEIFRGMTQSCVRCHQQHRDRK